LSLIHLAGVDDPGVRVPAERAPHSPITFPSMPAAPGRPLHHPRTATHAELMINLWTFGG
jgi:hypothetical protein